MAIKLGNTAINSLGAINKGCLGSTIIFGGGATTQYYLDLDSTQSDYLSILNATLNTDVPSTGNWAYGGRFTVPTVEPTTLTGLFGRTVAGASSARYGVFYSNGDLQVQGYSAENLIIPNFTANYGGQTIDIKAQYEGLDIVVYIDNVEIDRKTLTSRPSNSSINKYWIGCYGSSIGNPQPGSYFNGQIHSFFIGDNEWGCNEGSGNFVESKVGGYKTDIYTSNVDPNYINDFMWQVL